VSVLIYLAIPVFLITLAIEAAWARRRKGDPRIVGYATKDTFASLAMGLGNVGIAAVTKLGTFALMTWLYQYRVVTLPSLWWTWALLFVAEDFCYYWFHRASHESALLLGGPRQPPLERALQPVDGAAPVVDHAVHRAGVLAGVAAARLRAGMVFTQQAISLLYQYWIHTEAIDRLPAPLEYIFNTPSHHRVHHGSNPEYLDRNHGGILIIWDRLFGTFAPERARVRYGLTTNIRTFKPHVIAFHEWIAMARDARRAPTWRAALGYLLRPPGWRHDGTGKTSRDALATAEP
jgi:sterol desaturase/sphingolipid hydroxylase (fatty acid hydroxylase superfamily)